MQHLLNIPYSVIGIFADFWMWCFQNLFSDYFFFKYQFRFSCAKSESLRECMENASSEFEFIFPLLYLWRRREGESRESNHNKWMCKLWNFDFQRRTKSSAFKPHFIYIHINIYIYFFQLSYRAIEYCFYSITSMGGNVLLEYPSGWRGNKTLRREKSFERIQLIPISNKSSRDVSEKTTQKYSSVFALNRTTD